MYVIINMINVNSIFKNQFYQVLWRTKKVQDTQTTEVQKNPFNDHTHRSCRYNFYNFTLASTQNLIHLRLGPYACAPVQLYHDTGIPIQFIPILQYCHLTVVIILISFPSVKSHTDNM